MELRGTALLDPPESGTDRHPQTARPRHTGAANPLHAKRNSEHPGNPSTCPPLTPLPGSPALPAQKRQQQLLC